MGFHAGFTSVENEQISPTGGQWPQLVRWSKWWRVGAGAGQVRSVWMPVFLSVWDAASCTHLSHSRDLWISAVWVSLSVECQPLQRLLLSLSWGLIIAVDRTSQCHVLLSVCVGIIRKALFFVDNCIYIQAENIDTFAHHFMRMFKLMLFHFLDLFKVCF